MTPVSPTEVSSATPTFTLVTEEEDSERSYYECREKDIMSNPLQDDMPGQIFKLTEEETDELYGHAEIFDKEMEEIYMNLNLNK